MIKIGKKEDCCGCGACAQHCPKGCITMIADEEGFLYPDVDQGQCVSCGLCVSACPILNQRKPNTDQQISAYAAYSKEKKLREESSSGGIFSVLASWILEQNGVIFGAAFDDDFSVRHMMIESMDDLSKLRGSKYVQSVIGDTYHDAKTQLESGRVVLYSGVGCQIAGLKTYLGKEYDNLYTVDVLCHGTPSPKVWQKYLSEQEKAYGSKTAEVFFRNKETGWKNYSVAISFDNGKRYARVNREDSYMRLFLNDVCLRPSCSACRFKGIPHLSDITLGDAWGIENTMPRMDDDKGTSVVLIQSKKGHELWEKLQSSMCVQLGDVDVLLPPGADSRRCVPAHPNRSKFFEALNAGADVEHLLRLTRKSFFRRCLSFGKRSLKKIQKILKI